MMIATQGGSHLFAFTGVSSKLLCLDNLSDDPLPCSARGVEDGCACWLPDRDGATVDLNLIRKALAEGEGWGVS